MFTLKETDSIQIDDAILESLNNLFQTLSKNPIKSFSELIDQRTLLNICLEMDKDFFISLNTNFIFEKNIGILFAEMKELISKMLDCIKKSEANLKSNFSKDFDYLNINSLINLDNQEVRKLVNLIILLMFNCPERNLFYDIINNFEEFHVLELEKILERYMILDSIQRESIRESRLSKSPLHYRNTISNNNLENSNHNYVDSEYTLKFMSRIDLLEKDRDNLEKERIEFTAKINDLEKEIEHHKKDKNNLTKTILNLEETISKKEHDKEELNKIILNQNISLKHYEELEGDIKFINDFKFKIEEKNSEIECLNHEIRDIKESHEIEIKMYNDRIDILEETNRNNSEMKIQYEKMKDLIKEFQATKEKLNLMESTNKEFLKIKNNYMTVLDQKSNLEVENKLLEEKLNECIKNNNKLKEENDRLDTCHSTEKKRKNSHDENENYYINIINEKDSYIKLLESKVLNLEKIDISDNNKSDLFKKNEMLLKTLELELNKKIEEVELFKKDNFETKERYEKEFELMASSVYNLGLHYWSMKMEYAQKLSEKPNWLIKERQKYFNGDF